LAGKNFLVAGADGLIESIKQRKGRAGVFTVSEMSRINVGDWKEFNRAEEILKKRNAIQ